MVRQTPERPYVTSTRVKGTTTTAADSEVATRLGNY